KSVLDLSTILSKVLEQFRERIEERSQELSISLPGEPLSVDADATRMEQVFSNLLSNAVKYTGRGGLISVSASRSGNEVVVLVKDSGMGIPPDLLPRVFDAFVQGRQALDRSQGGLGSGLTLVKSLVELHGGAVAVQSAGLGKGSEFRVWLPLVGERRAGEGEKKRQRSGAGPSRRVLVV